MKSLVGIVCLCAAFAACDSSQGGVGLSADALSKTDSGGFVQECTSHPDCYSFGHKFCVQGVCVGDAQPDVLPTEDATDTADAIDNSSPDASVTADTGANGNTDSGSIDDSVDSSTDANTDAGTLDTSVDASTEDAGGELHISGDMPCTSDSECAVGGGCGCEGTVYWCATSACVHGFCGLTTTSEVVCTAGCGPSGCLELMKQCTADADCVSTDPCKGKGACGDTFECEYTERCIGIDAKKLKCAADADCVGTGYGDYCVESGDKGLGQSVMLCQPCFFVDNSFIGCKTGELCRWGVFSTGQMPVANTSDYWCEKSECQVASDCDTGDVCSTPVCSSGKCVNQAKLHCTPCNANSDCIARFVCDNKNGGVEKRFAECVEHNCRYELHSADAVVTESGCNPTMTCNANSDCPGTGGECDLHSCFYSVNNHPYPACRVDADCSPGTCDATSYQCTNWPCTSDADCGNGSWVEMGYFCLDDQRLSHKWGTGHCSLATHTCAVVSNEISCDDGDACTQDACEYFAQVDQGACQHHAIDQCCHDDSECGVGQTCDKTSHRCLADTDTFEIEIQCPATYPVAVIWYADTSVELQPDATFTTTKAALCSWGWDNLPTLKYNCRTASGIYGHGNEAVVIVANAVGFKRAPDVQYGDQGVMVLQLDRQCQ